MVSTGWTGEHTFKWSINEMMKSMKNTIELKELVSSNKMIGKGLKRKMSQSRTLFTKLSPDLLGQLIAPKFK